MAWLEINFFVLLIMAVFGTGAVYFYEDIKNWVSGIAALVMGYIGFVNLYIQAALLPLYTAIMDGYEALETGAALYLAGIIFLCIVMTYNTIKYQTVVQ